MPASVKYTEADHRFLHNLGVALYEGEPLAVDARDYCALRDERDALLAEAHAARAVERDFAAVESERDNWKGAAMFLGAVVFVWLFCWVVTR